MIAEEVANDEFARFGQLMDLDFDESRMSEEDRGSFQSTKQRVVREIMRGRLLINDNGEPVFSPSSGDPIVFHEPTGATILALDKGKKGEDIRKAFHALADFTGEDIKRFSQMPNRDFKVCQALMTLFLAG